MSTCMGVGRGTLTVNSSGAFWRGIVCAAAAILSDAYDRVKERSAIELTHARIKIITDQQFSLVGHVVMLVQLLVLLAGTVWVWLPWLVLALSNRVLGCCGRDNEATADRFGAGIAWVLGLDADADCWNDVIVAWYGYHCWLAWFYRGGDTTLTVVMPHDADIKAAQERGDWQEQGAPRAVLPPIAAPTRLPRPAHRVRTPHPPSPCWTAELT